MIKSEGYTMIILLTTKSCFDWFTSMSFIYNRYLIGGFIADAGE